MEKIKAYTDLEQSKKLAEILPIESADMYYPNRTDVKYQGALPIEFKYGNPLLSQEIAAWSLAALISVLPNNEHIETTISRGGWKIEPIEYLSNTWWCEYEDTENQTEFNISADNPVDACCEMIIKLHELKML